jgi:D-alanine-D-alanine ligase-like ATP-grasp enzyme
MHGGKVIREIFGSKKDGIIGKFRKINKIEIRVYMSPTNVRVVKYRRLSLAGQVVRSAETRNTHRIYARKLI